MVDLCLSFIIPTLNEEHFLPKLLADLQKQKEKNFEVIIVDGDSEDKTSAVIDLFKVHLPIRFFVVKKRNVAYQRNWGVKKAQGKYLVFLDADSRINSFFSKKITHAIRTKKSLIFIPSIYPQERSHHDLLIFKIANFFVEISQTIGQPISSGGSMIFQKDCFQSLGGFDEKLFLSEDHDIIKRAYQQNISAQVLKNAKVKVSLRRFKKEGHFDVLKNYLVAWIHYFINGGIYKKIFTYNMGGAGYLKKKNTTLYK